MRILLIGCEVIIRELCDAVARSPHVVDARFLSKGLHDRGARVMRTGLQAAIDEAEADAEKYDAIALGYGLCGNGLAGLEARSVPLVLPRAHDCITLLMGSRSEFESYFQGHPGVYYRSTGWVERGADLEPLARTQTGTGYTLDALIERYGDDNGRFLYEELTRYQQAYQQLTFIETGIEPDGRGEAEARVEAAEKGWRFEKVRGDLGLFRGLLAGDWDEAIFLVVPPGHRIVARPDQGIVAAEKDFTMNGKERVLAMFNGKAVDHLPLMPITMMFAADLIGVPYRDYAADCRVLAESQIRTADTFGFDYVSAVSDPAREVSDLGGTVEWFDNQPPAIVESRALLEDKARLATLELPGMAAPGRMRDRIDAVAILKQRTAGSLIVEGWVEGPCAMGADIRGLNTLMLDFHDDPDFVNRLFEFAVAMEIAFARSQVEAGADIIGVGDAAASLIGPKLYETFVLPHEQTLVAAIKEMGVRVRLHICGNTRKILRGMGSLGADVVDLDYLSPMREGRAAMGPGQVLLGNIDPVRTLRDGTPESITAMIEDCYREAGPRFVVGAGCEVPRGTPAENVQALTNFARSHQP